MFYFKSVSTADTDESIIEHLRSLLETKYYQLLLGFIVGQTVTDHFSTLLRFNTKLW